MQNIARKFCQSTPGMVVRGRCNEEERNLIASVWKQVRHNIDHATEATIWISIYLNSKYQVEETPEMTKLHSWASELVKKHKGQGYFLQQFGFFFTAKHP